ncbi:ATP-binding protein [Streptomyces sp. NPDC048659]|uniref:ATP-binding protein n=1 Tax=Streptomyces sp. NPDC048659 TaxID=3155489 RepID=UPI0034486B59
MTTAALAPPAQPPEQNASYRFTGPRLPSTPALARHWVTDLLRFTGRAHLVDRAELCTSEVVTNAYLHTTSLVMTVEVSLSTEGVTVCVHDGAPGRAPQIRPMWADPDSLTLTGRGLGLVDAYADQWSTALDESSKTVWFLLLDDQTARCAA